MACRVATKQLRKISWACQGFDGHQKLNFTIRTATVTANLKLNAKFNRTPVALAA